MKLDRKFVAGTILVSVILLTSTAAEAVSGELTVTPLLDTPGNQVYYNNLIEEVRSAKDSIRVMMSTADNYPKYPNGIQNELFDSLGAAVDRGVNVRVLLDESDFASSITKTNETTAKLLRARGVKVKLDDPKVTTHAKLIVVDEQITIIGSSNWNYPSYTDTYQSNVRLTNKKIAEFYGKVFDVFWTGETLEKIKLPELSSEAPEVVPIMSMGKNRTYFEVAKEMIEGARKSINLIVFKITRYPEFRGSKSNKLLKALVRAKNRGVNIRIILDVNSWSEDVNKSNRETTLWLLGQGIKSVSFDSFTTTTHSKVLIVDGDSVLIGSTNWSYYSLAKNREADVLLNNFPKVGRAYQKYFEKLWSKAEVPGRKELSGNFGGN